MLASENYSLDELANKLEKEWAQTVSVSGRKKEFLILELKEGADKQTMVERLAKSDIAVERYGNYEPSLNDIFVAKVGEDA